MPTYLNTVAGGADAHQPVELTPIEELVNGLQRMIKDALDKEEARRELAAEEGGDK